MGKLKIDSLEEACQRVARKERCKHNMIYEHCAICQTVEYQKEVKFPITKIDEDTGKEVTIWLATLANRYYVRRYR